MGGDERVSVDKGRERRLRFSIVAYDEMERKIVADMVEAMALDDYLDIHHCAHCPGRRDESDGIPCDRCDMAIVVLGSANDADTCMKDIAHMKLVEEIPAVMALADRSHEPFIDANRADFMADELLYFPVSKTHLGKRIRTHAASLSIHRSPRARNTGNYQHIGELLVENGIIDALELKRALEYQRAEKIKLGEALVQLGYIDQEQRIRFLAGQQGVSVATARQYAAADMNVVALIPERIARQYQCVALERREGTLTVAMTDVMDLRLLDLLRDRTELDINPIMGVPGDIATSVDRFYRDITTTRNASDLMADLGEDIEFGNKDEDFDDDPKLMAAEGAEQGIIKLVNMIVKNAVRDRASDIHVEPMENTLVIRYRIDGELRKVMSPPAKSHQAIITRVKILSQLNIAERRLPQDGRMVVKIGGREVDIRVSILPTVYGEKAVLRILDRAAFEHNVNKLGFSGHELALFREQIARPYGMVIVTGPTGSGKSTTLYSAVQHVKSVTRNIITVEDPVEFHIDGVSQVQVNRKTGLTFATALRSILRQDPDTILIGEIRDSETADIAIKMSLTGHMVYSTLHTNDAASAVARFTDIGVPPLLLASSLNLVIAQRLVRRVCPHCRKEYVPDDAVFAQLHLDPDGPRTFYRGEGCVNCNGTGFAGRVGIFEMLHVSREVRRLILKGATTQDIQDTAVREGMRTLRGGGIALAAAGETTIEQVVAATTEL